MTGDSLSAPRPSIDLALYQGVNVLDLKGTVTAHLCFSPFIQMGANV